MSEKEKDMLEKIAALPAPLQDKFLERIQGATMALDVLDAEKAAKAEKKDG